MLDLFLTVEEIELHAKKSHLFLLIINKKDMPKTNT